MDNLLELFYSEHDDYLLEVDLQMLWAWLVVAPPSKIYTVSTVLFRRYGGSNFAVKIACLTFLCFLPLMALWNWLMETRDMTKELILFYIVFLTVPLYIQWYKFIIVQFTLPTSSHPVPSNFMFFLKRLHLDLLNIVTLLTLKVVLGDHPTILKI